MTEKRFEFREVYDGRITPRIWDNEKQEYLNLLESCNFLNELHEDNQLLHKMNAEAIDFMYDNFDLNIMFTDRELNDICNEMGWELSEKGIKINQLEKENEQLKKQLFETSKELLWATSDEVDRALYYEDEVEELRKEIFE